MDAGQVAGQDELRQRSERALLGVARSVGLLAAVTPVNAAEERKRLESAFARGEPTMPEWRYDATRFLPAESDGSADDPAQALERIRALYEAERAASDARLTALYLARCEELALELALIRSVGKPGFGELAARRFPSATADVDTLSRTLAAEPESSAVEECSSDGSEPHSLASRVRALIGEHRLPFRVEVRRELAPMAATGDGVVLVAAGRKLTAEAAARTAMHEVFGHVLPRARAATHPLKLFAIGTAGGADEQEGYALLLEHRADYLRGTRARELAARHEAVRMMRAGADFVECVRSLRSDHGCAPMAAVRIAERTFRGGDGRSPGLGREAIYLASFARVRQHLSARPDDEVVLASGQVSTHAASTLREHVKTT